ncbi:MAG: hypothetical protein Q8P39_03240 [Candidatus Yanofskybacteria bacterium]|nr:hypothetical protein [Candidatus Yanofskybacteria bacterium]
MINLLPPERKQQIVEEHFFRLLIAGGIACAAALLASLLLLAAVLISITGKVQAQNLLLSSLQKDQTAQDTQEMRAIDGTLISLQRFYTATPRLLLLVEHLEQALPGDVELRALVYSPPTTVTERGVKKKVKARIELSGFASTRDAMLGFKQNLEEDMFFSSVAFPLSSYVARTDVLFSASMDIEAFAL